MEAGRATLASVTTPAMQDVWRLAYEVKGAVSSLWPTPWHYRDTSLVASSES